SAGVLQTGSLTVACVVRRSDNDLILASVLFTLSLQPAESSPAPPWSAPPFPWEHTEDQLPPHPPGPGRSHPAQRQRPGRFLVVLFAARPRHPLAGDRPGERP